MESVELQHAHEDHRQHLQGAPLGGAREHVAPEHSMWFDDMANKVPWFCSSTTQCLLARH